MYIICLTCLKLMMWVLICCLSQTAHFNIQLYLRKIERCFSFASPTCSFDTCCSASSFTLPHPFIHSLIHSFIHLLWQWIWTSDWVRGVGWKNEKKRKGREGALFSSTKPTLWPCDPAKGQTPFPLSPSFFNPWHSQLHPQHMQFLKWVRQCRRGDKGNADTNQHTCHHLLFDLSFLHLAFLHWKAINRLWPLMAQLSFVCKHVCTCVGWGLTNCYT